MPNESSDGVRLAGGGEVASAEEARRGPDPLDCSLCEGEGYVASGFGLYSDGRPDIVRCPVCNVEEDAE